MVSLGSPGPPLLGWQAAMRQILCPKIAHGSLVFQPCFGAERQAVQSLGDERVCQHPSREDRISLFPSASVIRELSEMLRSSPRKVSFN